MLHNTVLALCLRQGFDRVNHIAFGANIQSTFFFLNNKCCSSKILFAVTLSNYFFSCFFTKEVTKCAVTNMLRFQTKENLPLQYY